MENVPSQTWATPHGLIQKIFDRPVFFHQGRTQSTCGNLICLYKEFLRSSIFKAKSEHFTFNHAGLFVLLVELWKNYFVHLFVTPELTPCDRGSCLSTDLKISGASASLLKLVSVRFCIRTPKNVSLNQTDQLQHDDHVITLSSRRTAIQEDYIVICCVSNLQREQAVWLPPIIRHSRSTTPQSTHAVFGFLCLSPLLALTHHKSRTRPTR